MYSPFFRDIDPELGQGNLLSIRQRLKNVNAWIFPKRILLLSSFSGNSTISLTGFDTGTLFALGVSRKGRFQPGGRGPLS